MTIQICIEFVHENNSGNSGRKCSIKTGSERNFKIFQAVAITTSMFHVWSLFNTGNVPILGMKAQHVWVRVVNMKKVNGGFKLLK